MKLSIKIKWTLFIVLLLAVSIMFMSFFILKGVSDNQRRYYEELLKEHSKNVNLYIRESYTSSNYYNFEEFYKKKAEELIFNLRRIVQLPIFLYDMSGKQISDNETIYIYGQPIDIMDDALEGQIIYKKYIDKIIYLAPIYDFDKQIGVVKIIYDTERENNLYDNIKLFLYKIGGICIFIASCVGIRYFSKIAENILRMKTFIKLIEQGDYNSVVKLDRKDELGELSRGIYFMGKTIKQNIEDITTEKKKLELAISKLKKLEKQQKEFIGNITHEFKTPLTVLKAQLDLISLYRDDEELLYNSKEIAEKELKRLDKMIEKILFLSKVEKYEFEFRKEKINTKKILTDICNRMKGKASKFGIEIIEHLKDAYIFIDVESFMQIFINLIDNAIKYNVTNGRIYITSYVKDGKNYIQIEDTGIGIAEEYREKIFEPFYTVDKNRSKNFSGTGLGLSIVKNLVESQGGTIKLVDTKKVTCFEVVFPIYDE